MLYSIREVKKNYGFSPTSPKTPPPAPPINVNYIFFTVPIMAYIIKGGKTHEWCHFKKKHRKIWDKVPIGGGGVWPKPKFVFRISIFLETTNLASPYLKTCVTVKIWLNLLHTNLISWLILATVPVPGGGEWVVLGEEKKCHQKCLDCDFRFIQRPTKNSASGSPKIGGGGVPWLGHNPNFFLGFLVTPPLSKSLKKWGHWILAEPPPPLLDLIHHP